MSRATHRTAYFCTGLVHNAQDCLFLKMTISACDFVSVSPWYNCIGWQGVKHQVTVSRWVPLYTMHRTAYFWRWLFLCVLLLVSHPDITIGWLGVKHRVTVSVSRWLPLYTLCRTACVWRLLFLHSLLIVAHTGYPVKSCLCTWCAGSPVNVLAGRHWGEHKERHHLVPALRHGSRGARAAGTGRAA